MATKKTRQEKLAEAAKRIREYPLIWIEGDDGRIFAEVARLEETGEWEARICGKNYKTDRQRFETQELAEDWVAMRMERV